ncbi:hypothetical protein GCM10010442_72570 [Kitasatospora kifunensis]
MLYERFRRCTRAVMGWNTFSESVPDGALVRPAPGAGQAPSGPDECGWPGGLSYLVKSGSSLA